MTLQTVSYIPQTPAYTGVKTGDNQYIVASQGMTTEEFKDELKKNNPQLYKALEEIDKQYPKRELSEEEVKKLMDTRLGAVKAPKVSTLKKMLSKIESWISKQAEKPHHMTMDDVKDSFDKGMQIKDIVINSGTKRQTDDSRDKNFYQVA